MKNGAEEYGLILELEANKYIVPPPTTPSKKEKKEMII